MGHRAKHRNTALLRRALTGRRIKSDHTWEGQQRMLAAMSHIAVERMQKP